MTTLAEENYLKAIYKLANGEPVGTSKIAEELATRAASVTEMLIKLSAKGLINYKKYKGVSLTGKGRKLAIQVVRKHRLWELFLVEKLRFGWDEVHEVAEQLEHIQSEKLTERLSELLGNPQFDPHGEPIPDKHGKFAHHSVETLSELPAKAEAIITGVKEQNADFLQLLDQESMTIGTKLRVVAITAFDASMRIKVGKENEISVSSKVCGNLYVKRTK